MAFRFISSRILMATSLLALTSCSFAVETSNQDVTFLTPGAQNAYCDVYVGELRYQVLPPQTINVRKYKDDMKIKCSAPGNRVIEMDVPSKFSSRAVWGSPVGMAWDYASESMFYYPSVIAIDFSQVPVVPNEPPKHNASDILDPNSYNLEEITPSVPRLNSDRYKQDTPPLRRDEAIIPFPEEDAPVTEQEAAKTDKGSLMSIIDRLNAAPQTAPEATQEAEPKEISAPYPVVPEPSAEPIQIVPTK